MTETRTPTTGTAPEPASGPADALAWLRDAVARGQRFAILLGHDPAEAAGVVDALVGETSDGTRFVRVPAPTDSPHAFLEAILFELGFDSFEATTDDLQRLLRVVFRQASTGDARCVVVMEQAQHFGPRVFEAVRELARTRAHEGRGPVFVLTGTAALARVLDSRGMAGVADLTRERFRLGPAPVEAMPPAGAHLVVMRGHEVVQTEVPVTGRLMVGRSPHNDLVLASRYVSRHHAMIIGGPDGAIVMDLNSTNGTYVNSRAQRACVLRHGDWIIVGNYRLQYQDAARAGMADWTARPEAPALAETLVMRSLQPLRAPSSAATGHDSASGA